MNGVISEVGKLSLLPSLFLFCHSLLLTVFDCFRQVNEKQERRSNWQPSVQSAPAKVHVCECIPASTYVKALHVLGLASQIDDETLRE